MRRLAPFMLGYFFGYLTCYFTVVGKTLEAAIAAAIGTAALLFGQISREVVHPEAKEVAGEFRAMAGLKVEKATIATNHYRQGHHGKSYNCTQCKTR